MKIMLINPALCSNTTQRLGPIAGNLFFNSPPLGLCYLAAVLEKDKHEVKIIDAAAENLSADTAVKRARDFLLQIICH